jgi:hypothetical protein
MSSRTLGGVVAFILGTSDAMVCSSVVEQEEIRRCKKVGWGTKITRDISGRVLPHISRQCQRKKKSNSQGLRLMGEKQHVTIEEITNPQGTTKMGEY